MLERAWRQTGQPQRPVLARLLADAYQAEHVAHTGITALEPVVASTDPAPAPEALSLYGALNLVLAIVHARAGRSAAMP